MTDAKQSRFQASETAFVFIQACLLVVVTFVTGTVSAQQFVESDVISRSCVSGDCENDKGRMEIVLPAGKAVYNGSFKNGLFHGYGRLEVPISFTEKSVYDGNWEDGLRSGRGKFWNGTGDLYIGQWLAGVRHGHGSYFFNLPRWEENKHSEFWLRDNTENYTGQFVDDFYHGQGTFRWANGNRFEGGFFANEKHGQGYFYYANGTKRAQVWEYGNFVR